MSVVTDLEAVPVEVGIEPLEEGGIAPYVSNHDAIASRERMLVRLETDSGTTGWGELLVTMESPAATKAVVDSVVAPELVGRDVGAIREFVESFYFPYTDVDAVLGGVETAMWDALGRELGVPVGQLLGGRCRESVPVAFCLGILEPEASAEHAARARAAGFETLKTKAGPDWETDVDRLVAMDEAVDGDLAFRLDPNQGWSFGETVRAVGALEAAGVRLQYLEQPIRVETFGTYATLRSRVGTPIAVNEDTYHRYHLSRLVAADAIDVAAIDLVPAGGILRAREQAAVAGHAGVSVTHHCGFDLGIKTAAVLQTVAATPAIDLAPDSTYYAWADHVLEDPLAVTDGEIAVPDGPGLGVEVDTEAVERLRTDR